MDQEPTHEDEEATYEKETSTWSLENAPCLSWALCSRHGVRGGLDGVRDAKSKPFYHCSIVVHK